MTRQPDVVSRILGTLKSNPGGLNILEIAEKTGLNRMSTAKYLEVLTAQEWVTAEMFGRAKVYSLPKHLPVTAFLKHATKCYCITDSDLRVVQYHDKLLTISGLTAADIDGIRLPEIFGERIDNFGDCLEACRKSLAGSSDTVVADDRFRGQTKTLEIHHLPVQFPDGSPALIAVSQEITNRKQAAIELNRKAERFQRIVEHLLHVVVETDTDGTITYVNPRAAEWGLLPGNLLGRPFADLAVPDDRERVLTGLDSVQRSRQGTMRFRTLASGGRVLRIEADCRVHANASGACKGMVCLLRDVSAPMRS
jgi:PAS domain S-box-containing protein